MEVKLDKYGRLTIPKPIRARLGLGPGTRFGLYLDGLAVVLKPHVNTLFPVEEDGTFVLDGEVELDVLRWKRLDRLPEG